MCYSGHGCLLLKCHWIGLLTAMVLFFRESLITRYFCFLKTSLSCKHCNVQEQLPCRAVVCIQSHDIVNLQNKSFRRDYDLWFAWGGNAQILSMNVFWELPSHVANNDKTPIHNSSCHTDRWISLTCVEGTIFKQWEIPHGRFYFTKVSGHESIFPL